jgi:hypothetical protein
MKEHKYIEELKNMVRTKELGCLLPSDACVGGECLMSLYINSEEIKECSNTKTPRYEKIKEMLHYHQNKILRELLGDS